LIRAKGLTKDYGLHRAVDDVSFEVEPGEIVGLLGPNGSGKTTIMRMLTGFFAPTAGSCSIAGVDVSKAPLEARRHVGYLPERVALYPGLTVTRYLRFVARIHGAGVRVGKLADEAMERCGLAHVAKRHIGKLSRGYRQRVGIAQAIIHAPDVLILDEPTVGLDPRQIVEIRALIRELAGHTTILLSTHILPEVSITCRRVLILDKGRLVAENTAEGLTSQLAGRGETLVRVAAPESEILEALAALPGVERVEADGAPVDGVSSLVVSSAGDVDVKPALARAVVERGWDVHEITPRLLSLEDLFVQILESAEKSSE
jgi:ABC-2 type transport system ATP-binding protein